MKLLSNYKILFLTVIIILDSNEVKSEAFRSCLAHEDRVHVDEFITYHEKNQGISRFKKLKYFRKNKKRGFDDKLKQNLAIFNNILKKNLYVTNFVEGVDVSNLQNKII